MKTKARLVLICCLFGNVVVLAQQEGVSACLRPELVDRALSWTVTNDGWCSGKFMTIKASYQPGFSLSADHMDLVAQGYSKLEGHARLNHHDQRLSADTATVYRDDRGTVRRIALKGNVMIEQPRIRMVADQAVIYLPDGSGRLQAVTYRYTLAPKHARLQEEGTPSPSTFTLWGQACEVVRDASGNLMLHQVTYTTCSPHHLTWHLRAETLVLNLKQSRVTARNASLYWHRFPMMRIPYIDFPFESQRKSGFLLSRVMYSSQNGWDYRQPYYLNLAPNYDLTLLPHYFSKRGMMIGEQFRYLTINSVGQTEAHFMGRDHAFINFKASNIVNAPDLASLANYRYSLKWINTTHLDDNLHLNIDYQKVSDDYYLQDFSNNLSQYAQNQLRQSLALAYTPSHLQFELLLQRYQTLHPFNQSRVSDIYGQIPSVSLALWSPPMAYGLYGNLRNQVQRFVWYGEQPSQVPQGYRYAFHPEVGMYWQDAHTTFHPSVGVHATFYDLQHYNNRSQTLGRFVPDLSIDLRRYHYAYLNPQWLQVWQPRLHYLYVPYVSQTAVPVFDTAYFFPSYDRLFRDNRFVGGDRFGDANRLSFGLSTRFIHGSQSSERLSVSVGGGYQFHQPRVLLCENFGGGGCAEDVSQLAYTTQGSRWLPWQVETHVALRPQLSLIGSAGIDGQIQQLLSGLANLRYQTRPNHIVEVGYGFFANGDPIILDSVPTKIRDLHQIRFAYTWPLRKHWHTLGAWGYNIAHKFSMSYLFGVEYDDCCVGLRLTGGHVYRYYSPLGHPVYGNNIYLQLILKGLGSGANNNPGPLLHNFMPTLNDRFRQHV